MNDQPKPTTESREAGCTCSDKWPCPLHGGPPEQPKPATDRNWDVANLPLDQKFPPKPTGEWTIAPVIKSNGEKWLGIATIKCGERPVATLNEQEAKGLLTAINAALAAEGERREAFQEGKRRCEKQLDATVKQLAAVLQQLDDADLECSQLREQLAAERDATKKAYAEGWRVGRDFAVEGQRDTAANPPQTE